MIKLQKTELDFDDNEGLIIYVILDNDEPIGSLELYETENPELLVIDWIKIPDSLKGRTREVIRALKRLYPRVTRLQGLRITGSYKEPYKHTELFGDNFIEVRI